MDDRLSPGRFAVFVSRPGTGLPFARLPTYAEVWAEPVPAVSPDDRFRGALFRALRLVDDACSNGTACRARIGGLVRHGRYVTFQLAKVAVPRTLFAEILRLIEQLRPEPAPT